MSNVARVAGQAANTLSKPLNVEDVFSTYLYEGNGTSQTITNGIDLAGEGGLVWFKTRSNTYDNELVDTERGAGYVLSSNQTYASTTQDVDHVTSFNSDGFTMGGDNGCNYSGRTFASWTFRKAPKFFDVVTYTGTGSVQTISHNLGVEPGMIIVKAYSASGVWGVYHRSLGNTKKITLNETTAAETFSTYWNNTDPTSTEFTVGTNTSVNTNGNTYVAYLFAHNDGDGEFGPDSDQDIIKCGSYTTDASADATINLGWEPQWVLFRPYDDTSNWKIVDNMRGFLATATASTGYNRELNPNTSGAELNNDGIQITSTGFDHVSGFASKNFIYIAIRRGPMAVPTDATDVFALDGTYSASSPQYYSGWPVDFWMRRYDKTSGTDYVIAMDRLRGNGQQYLNTTSTAAESFFSTIGVGQMDGADLNGTSNSMAWLWRRAPNFFDVVAYDGNGSTQTINHNLGVVPEMIITKKRTGGTATWAVVLSAINSGLGYLKLDNSDALAATTYNVHPNRGATTYDCNADGVTNASGSTYIAYLFASLDGVSKVGSYTGNGSTQNIDCGFSSGARFVLIKISSGGGNWNLWDSERGIVAGNDPYLRLNTTDAEVTAYDLIDPYTSGFTVSANAVNASGQTYIFYAIA